MPYIINNGIKIYYETIGVSSKPALIFNHGNGNSLENWKDFGYIEHLREHFYLILVDARGFGKSDKPHTIDDYAVEKIVTDFILVLDSLEIIKAHYLGNSRGARMAFAFQALKADRFLSFTLCAGNPSNEAVAKTFIPWLQQGMPYFVAQLESVIGKSLPENLRKTFLANDARAMIAANQADFDFRDAFSFSEIPCLIIVGKNDPICDAVVSNMAKFKNAKLEMLIGYSHLDTYMQGDVISSLLIKFIRENFPYSI